MFLVLTVALCSPPHRYACRELLTITHENQKILERLQTKEPVYSHMDWELDRNKNERLIKSICDNSNRANTTSRMRPSSRATVGSGDSYGDYRSMNQSMDGGAGGASQMELTEYEKMMLARS